MNMLTIWHRHGDGHHMQGGLEMEDTGVCENVTSGHPLTHQGHRVVACTSRPRPLGPEQALQRPDPTATAQERPHHVSLVCSAGKARGEARENVTSGRPGSHRGHHAVARTSRLRA